MSAQARWTEKEGREFLRQWRRSGQSVAAFARDHGIEPQRLHYWRKRVEGTGKPGEEGGGMSTRAEKFIPGVVVGIGTGAPVTVRLDGRVVVEANAVRDLEPSWLAELVRALERA